MNKLNNLLLSMVAASALAFTGDAFAQSDEHHRQWNPSHPGYDGNRGGTSNAPTVIREVWRNHYGAIAADSAEGRGGFAEDQPSARAARREALRQCGTRNCKIVAQSTNGCLAHAYGGGANAYGGGNTAEEAAQDAINICLAAGINTCQIQYLHCNYPVRLN